MKYFIITYGCQMNKSDSERIAGVLEKIDYKPASNKNGADLIVVNMCSVRQSAVDRVYGLSKKIKELKKKNKNLKNVLTGCILKEDKKKFSKCFDLILNIKHLAKLPKILDAKCSILNTKSYFKIKSKYQNNFSAFIPISNGCNNFCTYCVVPYVRGPLICRPHQEILKETKNVIKRGLKEIWLLGQNVNDYKSRINTSIAANITNIRDVSTQICANSQDINFAKLLKMVNDIPGNFWIRFTSPHPKNFSDGLIEIMARCEKITPYLNLPVQSGDNKILRKMNRPYTIEQYKNLVKKIRKKIPEISLSTDVIVGFPGETKKQFENTLSLFKEIKYDMAYISKYSPRSGTAAEKLEDSVSPKEKERRYKILTEILKKTALENNKKHFRKDIKVLVGEKKNGFLIGKSRHYKTVKFKSDQNLIGTFANVKITNAKPWGLKGILR